MDCSPTQVPPRPELDAADHRRLNTASFSSFSHYTHQFPTHLRIDSILAGVLLAYAYHYHHDTTTARLHKFRPALLIAGVLLILPPFVFNRIDSAFVYTWGLTTNYLAGLCLIGWLIGWHPANSRLVRFFACIGRHSYSIYIWHMTLYFLLLYALTGQVIASPTWNGPYWLHLALFFAVTITLGTVLSVLVEVPVLRLRDRLSPSRSDRLEPMDPRDTGRHAPVKKAMPISSCSAQVGG